MSVTLHINGKPVLLEGVERKAQEIRFHLNGHAYCFRGAQRESGEFLLEEETAPGVRRRWPGAMWPSGKGSTRIQVGALEAKISSMTERAAHDTMQGALSPLAPMPGLVRQVLVKVGEEVKKGQPLVIMEAMKLQLTLPAGGDAVVETVLAKEGELVAEGAELIRLKKVG